MLIGSYGGGMKKLIVFVGFLLSQHVFAGSQNLQMVLDKVHKQGFYGCDTAIDKYIHGDPIQYVEVQLFSEKLGAYKPSSGDEVSYMENKPDSARPDGVEIYVGTEDASGEGAVDGYLVRKINGVCYGKHILDVREVKDSCANLRSMSENANSSIRLAGQNAGYSWLGNKHHKISDAIFAEGSGVCFIIRPPSFGDSGVGVKMDLQK